MNRPSLDLDKLLGEFRPFYNSPCNFNRLVHWTLISAECYLDFNDLEGANICYHRLMDYLEAIKTSKELRDREFRELPIGEFLRSNINQEMDSTIQKYFRGLNR